MLEGIILGLLQGIAEWLPISSEGVITLAEVYLSDGRTSLTQSIHLALFLHLGTFLSALIYFRRRVGELLAPLIRIEFYQSLELRNIFRFLVVSTVISGGLGFAILKGIERVESELALTGKLIMFLVGLLLLVTAFLQRFASREGLRGFEEITWKDALVLGLAQAMAVFPGLSRSGLTVSALLLLRVREDVSLELSFLMSLPIVFLGNVILNAHFFTFSYITVLGLFTSFLAGLITIHYLLKLARAVDFSYFVLFFAFLTFIAVIFI